MNAVEGMARAMCWDAGDNPDLMVYPPMQHQYACSKQHVIVVPQAEYYQPMPMWKLFERHAKVALEFLKDYPSVFGDMTKRKGSIADMYDVDRKMWAECIDKLLAET